MTAIYECRIESDGPHGVISLDAQCRGDGALWRTAAPIIGMLMKRTDSKQVAMLKRAVESRVVD